MNTRISVWLTVLSCFVLSVDTTGQTVLVKPYLQYATPTSIHILWETDTNTESLIQYGLAESLGSMSSGSAFSSLGGTIHHDVAIAGLAPGTRYFYQAFTGEWKSEIWHFVTPFEKADEHGTNIALMSDMQRDNGNPNVFHDIINNSLIPHIHEHYGDTLDDHLQMVMIPGDLVDNGSNFSQWKNHFFNPAEELWREIPVYPAPGNHENNSQNYFNYFHLPENGTPGFEEHWYVHDISNVRILGLDSNTPYRIAAQLNWVDSVLTATCGDTSVDFVFAQLHHPHKSELWTPGEIDYTGEVIERLEVFTDACGKPSVHFFGHTHAYSRGHSRDHQHVWMNVATAGGNIDYWGEFANADYDEFVISQDEYGFVIAEVTAGDNPQFSLRRLSFGDEFNQGGSTEVDLITIRINNNAPDIPRPLFPLSTDTVSPVCVTLQADEFADPDEDEHGASQWQISTDSTDFSIPVTDRWRQYENWYNETDLQAGDDLTDEVVTNLDPDQTYFWRVRFRDKGLEWSPWSLPQRFHTGTSGVLTGNLLLNGDAESGISAWNPTEGVIESLAAGECNGISPYADNRYFAVGALCQEFAYASAYQDVDVTDFATQIDGEGILVQYGAYLANWQNTDIPAFALQFLDASDALISGTDTISHFLSAWTLKQQTVPVPPGTRAIRFIVMGTRTAGADNDSYFDDIFLKLTEGGAGCSAYVAPGPEHGRIYVDKDAPGAASGESWIKAYRTLGAALLQSNADPSIEEIWIAEGMYSVTTETDRDTAFVIQRGVRLYGGFSGHETALLERNVALHPVFLSGETGDPHDVSDNVYHVIEIQSVFDTLLIDGIIVQGGFAEAPGEETGGGIYIDASNTGSILINQCVVDSCFAQSGSAVSNAAHLLIKETTLRNPIIAGETGGAIFNHGAQAQLVLQNCLIEQLCSECPEVLLNTDGAESRMIETVEMQRE